MRTTLIAAAALAALSSAASAQPYRGNPIVVPVQGGLSQDEMRDYVRDQVEKRQEMERRALRMHQREERRVLGIDDDD